MARAGWSKNDLRAYLYKHATRPVKGLLAGKGIVRDGAGNWVQHP